MEARQSNYLQFIVGTIVNLSSMGFGVCLGWTAPVLPKLADPEMKDSPLDVVPTDEEASWIGSILAIGAIISPLVAGPLADIIGRKWTLLHSSLFFIVSFIILLTTGTVTSMYIARFLQGLGIGFVITVQPIYIGEISTDDVRGALGSFMQLLIVIGILYVDVIGPYVSYNALQWACLAVPIAFVILFAKMPETPAYHLKKGNKEEALKSLRFLRGNSEDEISNELSIIQKSVEDSQATKESFFDIFKKKASLRGIIISSGLIAFQQLSGTNAILFYSTSIFIQAAGGAENALDPNLSTIIVSVVSLIGAAVTPLIADRLGRKIILLFSAAGMAVSLIFLGLFFYLDAQGSQYTDLVHALSWLPVTSVIFYVFVYCVGFGSVPWAVHGEIFSPEVKSTASTIVAMTNWILGFLVAKYFSNIDVALGTHWSFWIFAIFCIIAYFFTQFLVFETKGLTLQQIQDKLNGK